MANNGPGTLSSFVYVPSKFIKAACKPACAASMLYERVHPDGPEAEIRCAELPNLLERNLLNGACGELSAVYRPYYNYVIRKNGLSKRRWHWLGLRLSLPDKFHNSF
jgi:hypothetical protein